MAIRRQALPTVLVQARQLDLADRFLNTKSVKYLLRINKTQQVRPAGKNAHKQTDVRYAAYPWECVWLSFSVCVQALSTALLFSKEQDSDATPNLFDMQCMW